MSVFEYYCPVWANGSNSEISKVKHIQKRAAKIILNRSNGNSAVPLFNELKWLLFDNRLNYHIRVMTYKILNGHTPKYMCNLISLSHNTSYSELDSFGSSTVPGHLHINMFVFSRMSKYTDLLIIQSLFQI